MKKIKFKLFYLGKFFGFEWLDENGWNYYAEDLDVDAAGKILRTHRGTVPFQADEQIIRAQFTNSTDKNGKEIFEGDFVADSFRKYKINWTDWPGFLMAESKEITTEFDFSDECEVLGNIYENPGLLSEKQSI